MYSKNFPFGFYKQNLLELYQKTKKNSQKILLTTFNIKIIDTLILLDFHKLILVTKSINLQQLIELLFSNEIEFYFILNI